LVRQQTSARPEGTRILCKPFLVSEGWYAVSNGALKLVETEAFDSKEKAFTQRIVSENPAIENLSREYDYHLSDNHEVLWAFMDRLALSYHIQGFVD
jgi:hypothetical protein